MNVAAPVKTDLAEKPMLWANTVVDFRGTGYEKDFVVNGNFGQWIQHDAPKKPPLSMTPAEKFLHTMAGQFEHSVQADERFRTLRETEPHPTKGYYASVFAMAMNGSQTPHYHPAPRDFPKADLRILTVIPFANTQATDVHGVEHVQGIEFSMFNLRDPSIPLEGDA